MTIRAKFQLQEIINYGYSATTKTFVFRPQYDDKIPEDQRFASATPNGEFRMMVTNPAVVEQFVLGKYYYCDFTPTE